jgi:Zn-dependent protease with chaperone function
MSKSKTTFTKADWKTLGETTRFVLPGTKVLVDIRDGEVYNFCDTGVNAVTVNAEAVTGRYAVPNVSITFFIGYLRSKYTADDLQGINRIIVIHRDIYNTLTFNEFAGVLAHEIGHIDNGDCRTSRVPTLRDERYADAYAMKVVGRKTYKSALDRFLSMKITNTPTTAALPICAFVKMGLLTINGDNNELNARMKAL